MHNGINPLIGKCQLFYFLDNHSRYLEWFKGMKQIIHKCGLRPNASLPIKCTSLKHPQGQASCCCCYLLYCQPDFISQQLLLQEHIKSYGHLCNFYPKYHCELNFIKQYWSVTKPQFHIAGYARTLCKIERKMLECLNDIPLVQI